MADNDITPMTDGDITPPPASTQFEPATPLKTEGVDFSPADASAGSGRTTDAKQAIRDGAGKVGQQASEKLRSFADDGKARAGSALDQLSQLLTDAAGQVDDKLGGQYGQYARTAADQVSGFSDTIKNKNVDELIEDARGFVKASPAVAIGIAAALGFAVARLVQSGVDAQRD
ncbi:hypothetical protein Q5H91_02480 [Sphingomonas sp. KR1UV-12]|uniref:CsbD family protein n=1 Tax=Sphingomonas aurea TaxID=3063994 RepID=A0ABT9EGG7_9SPHN|nr:hypothetical protein [Sphingomonas sp. KR1UV-12]MDP1026065.1 hypothetical protein [Sphingomonas sp. KR1UV-12]